MKKYKGFVLLSFIIFLVMGGIFSSSFVYANSQNIDVDNTLNTKSFYNYNSNSECISVLFGNLVNYASDGESILLLKMYESDNNYLELYYKYMSGNVSNIVVNGKIQYQDTNLNYQNYILNNISVLGFENNLFKDFYILNVYQVEDGLGRIITKFEFNTCEIVNDVQYPLVRINYKSSVNLRYQLTDSDDHNFNALEFVGNHRTISKSISYYSNYSMILFTDSNSQSSSVWPDFLNEVKIYWEKTLSGLKGSVGSIWTDGYNNGYNAGFDDAVKQDVGLSPFWDVVRQIFNGVSDVMSVEIVPHISIGLIVLVPMVIGLVGFILWIWRKH